MNRLRNDRHGGTAPMAEAWDARAADAPALDPWLHAPTTSETARRLTVSAGPTERGRAWNWAGQALRHAPVGLVALSVLLAGSAPLAEGWFLASRLLYVGYVVGALHAIRRRGPPEDMVAREALWRRFRRRVSWIQDNDAAAFVALALATRGTTRLPDPAWPAVVVGALMCVVGLGVKAWATSSLPLGAYYWRNHFFPAERSRVSRTGPYRWLSHPMYSIGYGHAYGLALIVGSAEGLVAAAGAQALMLVLAAHVERRGSVEEPLCRPCVAAGRTELATQVDHIVPLTRDGIRESVPFVARFGDEQYRPGRVHSPVPVPGGVGVVWRVGLRVRVASRRSSPGEGHPGPRCRTGSRPRIRR